MTQKNSFPIISLLIANAISLVGIVISAIAIAWPVVQRRGTPHKQVLQGFSVSCQ